jgi:hypothetical protein
MSKEVVGAGGGGPLPPMTDSDVTRMPRFYVQAEPQGDAPGSVVHKREQPQQEGGTITVTSPNSNAGPPHTNPLLPAQPDRMMPYISVLDMLCHIPTLASIIMAADPLDIIGSENERIAFLELKSVISVMHTNNHNANKGGTGGDPNGVGINLQPLINKIRWCSYTNIRRSDTLDVLTAWDEIIKLIMVVIPPFRDVFLGQVESAQGEAV